MEKMKLRAHHLKLLIEWMLFNEKKFIEEVYGSEFFDKLEEKRAQLNKNTLIEIVDGMDDICAGCSCPFMEFCKAKDYGPVIENFNVHVKKYDMDYYRDDEHPDSSDELSLKEYGLEIGKTYRFGDIKKKISFF
jgi:hypothetical protein